MLNQLVLFPDYFHDGLILAVHSGKILFKRQVILSIK